MKKIIGYVLIGICVLLFLVEGFQGFRSALDIAVFIVLILVGISLLSGGKKPPKPPQPQSETPKEMVCPDCGKKFPLGQVYCDECGALLKKS